MWFLLGIPLGWYLNNKFSSAVSGTVASVTGSTQPAKLTAAELKQIAASRRKEWVAHYGADKNDDAFYLGQTWPPDWSKAAG